MKKFKLGVECRDKITGFTGIVTGRAEYITGCDQYVLQPKSKEEDFKEGRWFDDGRLEEVGKGVLAVDPADVQSEKNGCDQTAPIK